MTVVVKLGGAAGNASDPALDEIARRDDVVLVHGGSAEVDRWTSALGRPPEFYTSPSGVVSRRTRAEDLEVVVLALAGEVQTRLVAGLVHRGVRAVGLSGVDGGLVRARRKGAPREVREGRTRRLTDDRSGAIESVDVSLLRLLRSHGIVPVLGPPALSAEGEVLNVDADRIAAAVAVGLGAEALVLLSNVVGLLSAPPDPASRLAEVRRDEWDRARALATGRMRKKVLAAQEARAGGVPRVAIASSLGPAPVEQALAGGGTTFR